MVKRSSLALVLMLLLTPMLVRASHSFTDTINTPNFSYQVRFTNDNPYTPPAAAGDDTNYFPTTQAQNLANALNNNNVAAIGNPNGYHTGYTSLGFRAPDFGGTPRQVDVYDCSQHGGCDSGNAPADRINIPTTNYISQSEPCLRLIIGHELFHHVQYAYITFNKWSAWGNMPVEGTARLMQDKIYSDIDANAGCITYRGQVNAFLGSPNQTIWNASYSSALFWNYLTEQLGTTPAEPNIGTNFIETFWENARNNNANPNVPANMRRTIKDFDVSETLENVFHDFTIANVAKDLDVSGLNDATKYRYVDENDGSSGSYNQVKRRWSGNIPPQRGPNAESVVRWGARYYEATIGGDCDGIVGFRSTGEQAAYSLLAVKGANTVDRLDKSIGTEFARSFIQRSADPYTQLIAVVAGLGDDADFTYTFACGQADLVILDPTFNHQAYVGEPDDPDPFLIRLRVAGPAALGTPSVQGLEPSDFQVWVDGESPANVAPVLSGAYVQGDYWLVAQAPTKAAAGVYSLRVRLGNLGTDTKAGVVNYEKQILDQVLVIDRSGSMLSPAASPKLTAAQNAASLFIDAARSDDKIGVVSFGGDDVEPNDDAKLEAQLKDVTDANRTAAKNAIIGLNTLPDVLTSIGDGLEKARTEFAVRGNVLGEDWIVLLSDGMENEAAFWTDIRAAILAAGIKVQSIALGPYTDQALMQAIANDTGGIYYYVDVAPGTLASQDASASSNLPNRLADAYASSNEVIRRHERIYETSDTVNRGSRNTHVIALHEGGVEDGIFSINWNDATSAVNVRITRPDGSLVSNGVHGVRIFQSTTHYVAQVGAMISGNWKVEIEGARGTTDYMLILSGRNRQGARMRLYFGQYHDDNDLYARNGRFLRGLPMPILAGLYDDKGAVAGATVMASVEHPDGTLMKLPLWDDGNHGDGEAEDGIYGNLYTRTTAFSLSGLPDDPRSVTPQRGSYNVRVEATGRDNRGDSFSRIRKSAFQIFEGESDKQTDPDADDDGMPSRYEDLHACLDPFTPDGEKDADSDRLLNLEEWKLGTDPCDPDTDDGGENDGSEVRRRANPFDPQDDALPRPFDVEVIDWRPDHMPPLDLRPNSNLIRYPGDAAYESIRLYRASHLEGPFPLVAEFRPDSSALYRDSGLRNDTMYFYYLEGVDGLGRSSAPSPIFGGMPKADPVPPLGSISINLGRFLTTTSRVTLHLRTDDEDVVEMLISNRADFAGATWQPFQAEVSWQLEPTQVKRLLAAQNGEPQSVATVYVKLRDRAGNESTTYYDDIGVTSPEASGAIMGHAALADDANPAGIFVRLLNYLFAPPQFSDEEGGVFFSPMPPGSYDLQFEYDGYSPAVLQGVEVQAGQETDIGLVVLQPALRTYLPVITHP